jgi:hypothetical protein
MLAVGRRALTLTVVVAAFTLMSVTSVVVGVVAVTVREAEAFGRRAIH